MSVPSKSGRVNLLNSNEPQRKYNLTQRELEIEKHGNGSIGHYMEENNLTYVFFGKENINALHEYIQFKIFKETKRRIGRQSDMQLLILMRSIYFTHGKNIQTHILQQVKDLNSLVINAAMPSIISNMQQYEQYRKDVSTGMVPIDHPVFISEKGRGPNEFPKF